MALYHLRLQRGSRDDEELFSRGRVLVEYFRWWSTNFGGGVFSNWDPATPSLTGRSNLARTKWRRTGCSNSGALVYNVYNVYMNYKGLQCAMQVVLVFSLLLLSAVASSGAVYVMMCCYRHGIGDFFRFLLSPPHRVTTFTSNHYTTNCSTIRDAKSNLNSWDATLVSQKLAPVMRLIY